VKFWYSPFHSDAYNILINLNKLNRIPRSLEISHCPVRQSEILTLSCISIHVSLAYSDRIIFKKICLLFVSLLTVFPNNCNHQTVISITNNSLLYLNSVSHLPLRDESDLVLMVRNGNIVLLSIIRFYILAELLIWSHYHSWRHVNFSLQLSIWIYLPSLHLDWNLLTEFSSNI
jgi:hypothetical protein